MRPKSNILLIMADQLRKDSLGCYGNSVVHTPHIDSLAQNGIKMERCYVANPICMPNRLSLFTGMHVSTHGLWTNGVMLPQRPRTLADELTDGGYRTASFGKIHFEPTYSDECWGSRESRHYWKHISEPEWNGPYWGFEHVELTIDHTLPLAHYGKWFYDKGGDDTMLCSGENGQRPLPPELHDSTFVAERTVDFLRRQRGTDHPFFAVASFADPHHPFNPPQEMMTGYRLADALPVIGSERDLSCRPAHYREHYAGRWHRSGITQESQQDVPGLTETRQRIINTYGMVNLIDRNIGEILRCLKEENLFENTIIVVTSDHGELLGDHGLWYKGPFYYEGLLNTPCIFHYPQWTARSDMALFSAVDLFPTLCELAGIDIPVRNQGISLAGRLKSGMGSRREHCLIEYRNGYREQDVSSRALIGERYKYVYYENGEEELTDLQQDPGEKKNLIATASRDLIAAQREAMLRTLFAAKSDYPEQIAFA